MRLNRKNLAKLYNIHERTLGNYLKSHIKQIQKMSTKILIDGKVIKLQSYNRAQLSFIIKKILKDTPEGYELVEGRLIKIDD